MREIKFRIWYDKEKTMIGFQDFSINQEYSSLQWISRDEKYSGFADLPWGMDEDNIILMQYTGLKDKNGREIYEGDIVIPDHAPYCMGLEDGEPVTIEWLDCGGWYPFADDQDGMVYPDPEKSEIIGNIYENPEVINA